jgi:hypothetical protein
MTMGIHIIELILKAGAVALVTGAVLGTMIIGALIFGGIHG